MLSRNSAATLAATLFSASLVFGAPGIETTNGTVGKNLQAFANIRLAEPAPDEGLVITVASDDPARLLLSQSDADAGTKSIQLNVGPGRVQSHSFWFQARGDKGTVTYTASAPGRGSSKGTITLAPSGIVIAGPFRTPTFPTTDGADPSAIIVYTARLDATGRVVEKQPLAGGMPLSVDVTSSNPAVGTILSSPVRIPPGGNEAATMFKPASAGQTVLALGVAPGFIAPAGMASVKAIVSVPGLGLSDEIELGKDLELKGSLSLGQAAPAGGLSLTIVSSDPSKLLISPAGDQVGSKSLTIEIPAGAYEATYFLQGLSDSGTVDYSVTARGYRSRSASVHLKPSGVVITFLAFGPPDRAEVARPHEVHPTQGFLTDRKPKRDITKVAVWMVQLDPVTRRGADITVQPLRAGITAKVRLQNSDPSIGSLESEVVISGGHNRAIAEFKPLRPGTTTISVLTPSGFSEASNSQSLPATVKE